MSVNREKYQAFAKLLEQFCDYTTINQLDAPGLRQRTVSLQQFFQQQIAPLADEDVDSPNASREQSYRTEISKQLRLLEMDVMFFQGARQASTATARLQTISTRLTTLLKYCDAILQPKQSQE